MINEDGKNREMTNAELEQHQKDGVEQTHKELERQAITEATAAAKASGAAKLAALGFTPAEIAAW